MSTPGGATDEGSGSEDKPLIGSLKRKRKSSSIKRNIILDEKSPASSDNMDGVETDEKLTTVETRRRSKRRALTKDEKPQRADSKKRRAKIRDEKKEETESADCVINDQTPFPLDFICLESVNEKSRGKDDINEEKSCDESDKCMQCNMHRSTEEGDATRTNEACEECGKKRFETNSDPLGVEMDPGEIIIGNAKGKLTCEPCRHAGFQRYFNTMGKLKHHLKSMHKLGRMLEEGEGEEIIDKFISCDDCMKQGNNRYFATTASFKCHIRTIHQTQDKSTVSGTEKVKKQIPCVECEKVGVKRYYSSAGKLQFHMKAVHEPPEEVRRFQCRVCVDPMWFPTKAKFCYHLGSKHPGVVQFVCDVCTETFKLKTNYKSHLKTHNIVVQKKFSCHVCKGSFVNKAGFEAHQKRFPGPHIKKSCKHCGFSFSKEQYMRNHRCKKLLLEEGANRTIEPTVPVKTPRPVEVTIHTASTPATVTIMLPNTAESANTEPHTDLSMDEAIEKEFNSDSPSKTTDKTKKMFFRRIAPRPINRPVQYRPVQVQPDAAMVQDSIIINEFREIDFEKTSVADTDQQIIVRDFNGQVINGNQILQFDINDVAATDETQVYLADWSVVAPFVIKEKSTS